jgi:hypothetical protein
MLNNNETSPFLSRVAYGSLELKWKKSTSSMFNLDNHLRQQPVQEDSHRQYARPQG